MKQLQALVARSGADTRKVDPAEIQTLEQKLGFALSADYKNFLSEFGQIEYGHHEMYGLGMAEDYFLHVFKEYKELVKDHTYPAGAVPLLEIGDGHYYLYLNRSGEVIQWATPNGGVVRVMDTALEPFLCKVLFGST
ncbi:SMI1/KNR4 family protein [Herbaspirillum lusitanum]|uniref:SMI1/KNR4 family protein n=1 Tax=Herbaspirillum lusitanum TaxID=213312 RepID=A0ABW9AAY3_9BURK